MDYFQDQLAAMQNTYPGDWGDAARNAWVPPKPQPAQPSRHLIGPKPLRYTPASHTDIRATFAKFARLIRIQTPKVKP